MICFDGLVLQLLLLYCLLYDLLIEKN